MKYAAGLKTADLSSFASEAIGTLSGSWGDHSAPVIVSVAASNCVDCAAGIGVGDKVTVTFDKDTNEYANNEIQLVKSSSNVANHSISGNFILLFSRD